MSTFKVDRIEPFSADQVTISGGVALASTASYVEASNVDGLTTDFDSLVASPFTQSNSAITSSKSLVPDTSNLDLGSPSKPWKDLYLSSASLYINGQQVLSSDANELIITTDANQSLKILEEGEDTVTIQTVNGDITLSTTGTGNIELNAPIQIEAGNQILSSDGNAIQIGEDVSVTGNITVTGTVDGVDIAQFQSDFTGFSSSLNTDFATDDELASVSSSLASRFDSLTSDYTELQNIPSGIVSSSSQVTLNDADKTGFDTDDVSEGSNLYYTDARVKSKLNSEGVVSGSVIAGDRTFSDNITVGGNLTIQGTTTTIDSTTVNIGDNIISLNGSGATNGGIEVNDGPASGSFIWDGTLNYWKAGAKGSESEIITTSNVLENLPTNTVSGSAQIASDISGSFSSTSSSFAERIEDIENGTTTVTSSSFATTASFALNAGGGGGFPFSGSAVITGSLVVSETVTTTELVETSARSLKENIKSLNSQLDNIEKLNPVQFSWAGSDQTNYGFIADEIASVYPEFTNSDASGVQYSKMVSILSKGIQDLYSLVKQQEKRIKELESK